MPLTLFDSPFKPKPPRTPHAGNQLSGIGKFAKWLVPVNKHTVRKFIQAVCCLSFLLPLLAHARFGGGHHYSSHHSSSHHSYSHSSYSHSHASYAATSGSDYIPTLVILTVIALVLGAAWIYLHTVEPGSEGGEEAMKAEVDDLEMRELLDLEEADGHARADRGTEVDPAALAAHLEKSDPAFDLQALLDQAKEVFLRAQSAWSARDLEPIRGLMSDASFQRFSTQLSLMKAQNVRNAVAEVKVREIEWAGLEQSQAFDTVHVRIAARLRDVDLPWDTPTAEVTKALKKAKPTDFVEYWSFVRKPGAQTKRGITVLNGKCPQCGAPYEGGASNKCDYCDAIVSSGNYDWTLAEITQSTEVRSARGAPPGLDSLRKVDPAFSLEMLEDRASLIFWKWIEAESKNQPDTLSKLAKPEQVSDLRRELAERESHGTHRAFLECAVGAVNTVSLSNGPSGQRASIEIRWSAREGSSESRMLRSSLVLERGAGAKTKTENGMSTSRCPECGAPLTDSQSTSCDFCGHALASGKDDWVLARLDPLDATHPNDEQDLTA